MVKEQHPYVDEAGVSHEEFVRTYSDEGKKLIQLETGYVYEDAVDLYPSKYHYREYDEAQDESASDEAAEAAEVAEA